MIVRFGLHADGLDPSAPATVLGDIRLGPRGLLEMLETDLGLPPVLDHPAAQLARSEGLTGHAEAAEIRAELL